MLWNKIESSGFWQSQPIKMPKIDLSRLSYYDVIVCEYNINFIFSICLYAHALSYEIKRIQLPCQFKEKTVSEMYCKNHMNLPHPL